MGDILMTFSYQIPKSVLKFLLNARYLQCCTIDKKFFPHIVPLVFYFDTDKSLIYCVAEEKSTKVRNMKTNPFVAFTTDIVHPHNPLLNSGIMIQTKVEISKENGQITEIMIKLQTKYQTHFDSKLLSLKVYESDVLVIAHPSKIVYWKGPFFQRFNL